VLEALALGGAAGAKLRVELLESALERLTARALAEDEALLLLGQPFRERKVRAGLEQALRQLARFESDRARQIALVDRANGVRPVTWL
jgi:serine/threonine-protein kinase PknG